MTRRRTYPGSIYADRGRLYIHIFGVRHATGLSDNKAGRIQAERLLVALYEKHYGVDGGIDIIPDLTEAFDEFKHSLVNRLDKTIRCYKDAFNAIAGKVDIINESEIRNAVINYLRYSKHSQMTKFTYINQFGIFLNYCNKRNWLPKIDLKADYMVKKPDIIVKIWTEDEISLIVNYLRGRNPELSLMLEFMTLTGARIIDCLTLDWLQIQFPVIIWKNKRSKRPEPRPISQKAYDVLLSIGREQTGKVFKWKYSTESRLIRHLKNACKDLNIEMEGRGYQEFRIVFRNRLLEAGCSPEDAQYLMRHSSMRITNEHYTFRDSNRLKKVLEKVK